MRFVTFGKARQRIFPHANNNQRAQATDTVNDLENVRTMESGRVEQLEYILGKVSVGIAILDAASLLIRYANAYLLSLLDEPWCNQDVRECSLETVIPGGLYACAQPLLQQVASFGQRLQYTEVAYEGFLESRGRTYWNVTIERTPAFGVQETSDAVQKDDYALLLTLEDVTESVRSRLHLHAIHYISSAIAGPSSLYLVLDRILQVLQEMFGSKRCAILLLDHITPTTDERGQEYEDPSRIQSGSQRTATIAAQQGIHPRSQVWRPQINEQVLLGRVIKEGHTLIITDTSATPDIELPFLDYKGNACLPGSVLCVPIFEPHATRSHTLEPIEQQRTFSGTRSVPATESILGSIEVYHRSARSFPAEEVKLLERFAQQAGLAIQNARLFRGIDRWARSASRHARQKENIMQAIPDGVVIYDPRWRVADANQSARTLLGWSDDVIGLPIVQALEQSSSIAHADVAAQTSIAELEQRALAGQFDELKMVGTNGQHYTMRCSYTPIRDDLGDIFAFIVIYHDISEEVAARERIEAEVIVRTAELEQRNEALQQAKADQELASARMALLLKHLPSGVVLVSAQDTSITVINHHAIQLLQSMGIPIEYEDGDEQPVALQLEPLLRSVKVYGTAGTLIPYEEQPLSTALRHGKISEAELHTIRRDGQLIHLLVNAAPLRASDGTISSAILVLQELTRIKALERAREDFFTTMAHELKTPLANIRAHLSALLARDLEWSSAVQQDFLQTADEQVDRLVGMINHFLDASRVEAGALRLELEPLLIPELLEDLEERLEALITSSQRSLQIILAPDLPAVGGDYELIMSVLTNLLSNAFRYAPEGDAVQLIVEPHVILQQSQPGEVVFSVADRGPGISPEQQVVLFTRFSTFAAMIRPSVDRPGQPAAERGRKSARWSPATGLGLYISRGIIEAHGSQLILKSSPGHGATFSFTLPVYKGKPENVRNALVDEPEEYNLEGDKGI